MERERRMTTWIYYIVVFMVGMECSCIAVSIMYYLKDDLQLSHPKTTAGIIMSLHTASTSVFGLVFSRYVDRTNNMRLVLMSITIIGCIGNILYTFKWHLVFVALGRVMCGVMATANTYIAGIYCASCFLSYLFLFPCEIPSNTLFIHLYPSKKYCLLLYLLLNLNAIACMLEQNF